MASLFVASSLYHQTAHRDDILLQSFQQQQRTTQQQPDYSQNSTAINESIIPRLQYVRPPGQKAELLAIFEEVKDTTSSSYHRSLQQQQQQLLPKTPKEIAQKYGIPETSRDVQCSENGTTTIGWIPNAFATNNISTLSYSGRIPRLIFQSWKTNELRGELCRLVLQWSRMNPEYDYFLFDDTAVDQFIRLEYGTEIFSSYACVQVGAAKCDVWRLLVVYLFGGIYFDADVKPQTRFAEWNWGNRSVVTSRSCTNAPKKHPGGCAHQWGLIYTPHHPVLYAAIRETLSNLAERKATTVYDVSFWSYYNAWRGGPYNQSYMPGWGEEMGGRVLFQDNDAKGAMVEDNGHWQKAKQIWHDDCL